MQYRNKLATIIANILYRVNPNIQLSYYLSAANGIVSVEQALAEVRGQSMFCGVCMPHLMIH